MKQVTVVGSVKLLSGEYIRLTSHTADNGLTCRVFLQ